MKCRHKSPTQTHGSSNATDKQVHRFRGDGGWFSKPFASSDMTRLLQAELNHPTSWSSRMDECMPSVNELFARLSDVIHPSKNTHKLTIKINKPVIKKLKGCVGKIWNHLLPILVEAGRIDSSDDVQVLQFEETFYECMGRFISHLILWSANEDCGKSKNMWVRPFVRSFHHF
jgi:hypothetical protein